MAPGPPVVLLHGGFVTADSWAPQLPALVDEWHVFMPERRGHGRTPDVDGPLSLSDMATDTIVFMESVVGGPAVVVGWSDGGIVALLVAVARPDLVSKMVLVGTTFDTSGQVFDVNQMVAAMSPDDPDMRMMRDRYAALSPDGAEHWPIVFEKVTRMWTEEPHITLDEVRRVTMPVLVVVGDDDLVSLSHTVELYENLPDAALAVIPFASHTVLMERPDVVNPLVVDLLKGERGTGFMPVRRAGTSAEG